MVKVSGFFKGHASFIIQPISIVFRNSIKLYNAYTYSSLFSGFQFVCLLVVVLLFCLTLRILNE